MMRTTNAGQGAAAASPLRVIDCLASELQGLPRGPLHRTSRRNLELIQQLGRPETCEQLLRDIRSSESLLNAVAARSYRHVNHFDKIVLVEGRDERAHRLTLHLWRPPYTREALAEELIHEHRFDFWSTVVLGSLAAQDFLKSSDGEPYRAYRYYPESTRGTLFQDFYEFSGETRLTGLPTTLRPQGSSYSLRASTIHRIELAAEATVCTLVLRGPRLARYSTVYNTSYPTTDTRIDGRTFRPSELAQRLDAVLGELRGAEASSRRRQEPQWR